MAFLLSGTVNKDKIFLVKRSKIEDVWNTEFYKPEFLENRERLKKNKFGLIKLQNITSKITKGETPLWRGDDYLKEGVRFVKSENVLENELNILSTDFVSKEVHLRMKRSQLSKGDVLLNIVGASIGRACVYDKDEEANINQAVCLIRLIEGFNPYWLSSLLTTTPYKTWINQLKSGGARDNIDLGQAKNFLIPNHPTEVQEKIILIVQKSGIQKKKKEAQAQQLLDSIDTYLLNELGIELPVEEESTISQRMFIRKFSDVSGRRFDPVYFEKRFTHLIQTIQQSSYQFVPLGTACSLLSSGKTPARDEYSEESTDYPIIKVASYQGDTIALNKTDFVASKQPYAVEKGDIFVLSAAHQPGYVGRFVKQLDDEPEIPTSFVGELICLRANNSIINPYYLFGLFASETFQTLMNREKRGQTSHIYSNDIKHILIPLPPLEKQNEIADHIQTIRYKAKQLRAEAAAELDQAKREVEAMIIGKDST